MKDIHEANNTTNSLITEEQLLSFAERVVNRYAASGVIPAKEKDDVKMAMIEKFLSKQKKIKSAYSGDAKISTYCIAVLNRMCCEVIRKELKHWKNSCEEEVEAEITRRYSASEQFIIKDEVRLLEKILKFHNMEYHKIVFCLAFIYHLDLKITVVEAYDTSNAANNLINQPNVNIGNKGDQLRKLAEIINLVEGKSLKPDAIRMWVNKIVEKTVSRLNGPFNRTNYDKESFQILFEYYYENRN